jgi:hypothetical protein
VSHDEAFLQTAMRNSFPQLLLPKVSRPEPPSTPAPAVETHSQIVEDGKGKESAQQRLTGLINIFREHTSYDEWKRTNKEKTK